MSNFYKNKRIFITGATGLLGSHMTAYLKALGANIISVVRDGVEQARMQEKDVTQVFGDILDYDFISRTINEHQPSIIFHLAAQPLVQIANKHPRQTLEINVMGTVNVLEAARINGNVKVFCQASSDKAYGQVPPEKLPYKEDTELKGIFPYDCSKSCCDLLSQMYYQTYKVPVEIVRSGNMYGPLDMNFGRIVPDIFKYMNEEKPLIMRTNGDLTRDMVYVEDMVIAYLMLAKAKYMNHIAGGEAFNFGHGNPVTMKELISTAHKLFDHKIEPNWGVETAGEISNQYLDSRKAKEVLGWEPIFDLEESLKITGEWYLNYFKTGNTSISPSDKGIKALGFDGLDYYNNPIPVGNCDKCGNKLLQDRIVGSNKIEYQPRCFKCDNKRLEKVK